MKLSEYLETKHGYAELLAIDKNGKECGIWFEDDPKYDAEVLTVETNPKCEDFGIVTLDYEI